jgi:hypothetical protein
MNKLIIDRLKSVLVGCRPLGGAGSPSGLGGALSFVGTYVDARNRLWLVDVDPKTGTCYTWADTYE